VREEKILLLETAINKMTALSADHVGIQGRGLIATGYYADLVLFDPDTVQDNANTDNAKAISDGIITVWVNGQIVFEHGGATNQFPGVFLSR
jgi:N-acyl-D-aspartate/D-glutamate deacylase